MMRAMRFLPLELFFPVVLAIHNIEECARPEEFIAALRVRLPERWTTRRVVCIAAACVTLAATLLTALTWVYRTGFLVTLSRLAILILLLNALGHCALSLRRRRLFPGTITAALVVIPYSAAAILSMHAMPGGSRRMIFLQLIVAVLLLPIVTLLSLLLSYGLSRVAGRLLRNRT
jgi:hypothetical protein